MLIQFKLRNAYSYKEETAFSLLASSEKGHDSNLIPTNQSAYPTLLKVALLYGANASGKSNVLKALALLQSIVANGHLLQQGQKLYRPWFRLDRSMASESTVLEAIFIEEGIRYAYGLEYREEAVAVEYLYHWPEGRKAIIFERSGNDYKFTKKVEEQRQLSARAIPIAPYLSVAAQWNLDLVAPAFRWLTQRLVVVAGDPFPGSSTYLNPVWRQFSAERIASAKKELLDLFHAADFSIADLSAKRRKIEEAEIPPILLPEIRESMKSNDVWDIQAFHAGKDGQGEETQVPFFLQEESLGTQRFFELSGPWLDILANDKVCFMDEFDTGLHPELAEFLLSYFIGKSRRAQFVFTTHNTTHLSSSLVRRDQVWIAEISGPEKGSDLFSLSELGLRNDHNLEKGYLAGKYGGIPLTGVVP